jgi:hypothetical protein
MLLCALLAGTLLVPGSTVAAVAAADKAPDPARPAAKLSKAGFRVGKWDLQQVTWKQLHFTGGTPMHVKTVGPQDDKGVPMRPLGPRKSLVYNPTVLAQQGMKRLDTWQQTGKSVHLRYARKIVRKLDELAVGNRRLRWQPHQYARGGNGAGWVNSNSHGLALSLLSRFHRLTGSAGALEDARDMLAAFGERKGDRRWFSVVTPSRHIWFEHWPGGRYVHTLNAHLNALFGLYDYWQLTGSPKAKRYFLGGAQTVRAKLHKFRREGKLSRYSLSSTNGSLHYHHTHIWQLRLLARMTGDPWFAKQAQLFKRDERAWRAAGRPD